MIDMALFISIITQTLVESLPISSGGHVLLVQHVLHRFGFDGTGSMPDCIDSLLHNTALVVIAIFFYKIFSRHVRSLLHIAYKIVSQGFSLRALSYGQRLFVLVAGRIIGYVIVVNAITVLFYACIKIYLRDVAFLQSVPGVLCGFVITCCLLFISDAINRKQVKPTWWRILLIGCAQGIALLPGISRFAITVVACQLVGLSRRRSLEFSFLMFTPLLIAAFLVQGVWGCYKEGMLWSLVSPLSLCVYGALTVGAYALFSWACRLYMQRRWKVFGYYMVLLIALTCLIML